MDLFAPHFSLLALISAALAGYAIGHVRGSNPRRSSERLLRDKADSAAIDEAFARLPEEKRRDIERLAKSGRLVDAIRDVRKELGCDLKAAKDLIERLPV